MRRCRSPWVWVVLGLLAAHDLTHLLDDGLDTSPGQLALVAIPQWIALGVVMAIVLRGDEAHRPMAALALGVSVVLGFAVVICCRWRPPRSGTCSRRGCPGSSAGPPRPPRLVLTGLAWPLVRSGPARTPTGA